MKKGEIVYLVHGNADVFADEEDAQKHAMKWIREHMHLIVNQNDRTILQGLIDGGDFELIEHFYNRVCPERQGVSVYEQEVR